MIISLGELVVSFKYGLGKIVFFICFIYKFWKDIGIRVEGDGFFFLGFIF